MSAHAKRTTRADVASAAGVSVATVSYVLNDSVSLPEATRKRVLEAADRLNYRPNNAARSLATQKSMQLAIVVNNIANPIYADLILGFEDTALAHGYFVTICTGSARVDEYFENFAARGIDGLFVEVLPDRYHADRLRKTLDAGIPVVVYGSARISDRRLAFVSNDYHTGMNALVSRLGELGHRHICYVSGLANQNDTRLRAYAAAMADHLPEERPLVTRPSKSTGTTIADGRTLALKALSSDPRPTALICTNDLMAVGALQAARAAGLTVPRDLSVAGIDNAMVAELCTPPLTTLAADYRKTGSRACEILLAAVAGRPAESYTAPLSLVERASTAARLPG